MRDKILNTGILLIDEKICEEIYKSLEYSTHINLFVFYNEKINPTKSYSCGVVSYNKNEFNKIIKHYKVDLLFIAGETFPSELIKNMKNTGVKIANNLSLNSINETYSKKLIDLDNQNKIQHYTDHLIRQQSEKFKINFKLNPYKIVFDSFKSIEMKTVFSSSTIFYNNKKLKTYYNNSSDFFECTCQIKLIVENAALQGVKSIQIPINNGKLDFNAVLYIPAHLGWKFLRAQGINIPLLCVQNFLLRSVIVQPLINNDLISWYRDISLIIKINYGKIFVDLDETLIIGKKSVNLVLDLLIDARERKKNIILITRHKLNILKTLADASINNDLFNEIIHVKENEKKSDIINNMLKNENQKECAIFIDNEFPERYDVFKNCRIPVFDVNGIEFIC